MAGTYYRPGTGGISTAFPKAGDIPIKSPSRNRGGGGSSRISTPSVSINGDTVFINGQGFSVAPSQQAAFIQQKTGGAGSSAANAIAQAKITAEKIATQERLRQEELRRQTERQVIEKQIAQRQENIRIANLKNQTNIIKKEREEINRLKNVIQNKEYENFQTDLKTGKIQGFSGIGLSPSEWEKRKFLIKTGILKEQSSKDISLKNVDPLVTEYFIDTAPTGLEKKTFNNFVNYIKSEQFSTKIYDMPKAEVTRGGNLINTMQSKINQILKKPSFRTNIQPTKNKFMNWIRKNDLIASYSKRQVALFALALTTSIVGGLMTVGKVGRAAPAFTVRAVKGTPNFIKNVYKNPIYSAKAGGIATLSFGEDLVTSTYNSVVVWVKLLPVEPGMALGQLGGEYVKLVALEKGFKVVGKISQKFNSKLNPYFRKLEKNKITLRRTPAESFIVRGEERLLKRRVQSFSIKRPFTSVVDFLKGRKPGQFAAFTKDPGLVLKKSTVSSGASSLGEQVRLAGRQVTAVNAAADQLTNWLKRKKIIRKPIEGEVTFPTRIKAILNKFDNGKKLTTREFADVNLWLQKNVAPNITLLERSLYLDPAAGLRISRLGIQAERSATLKDILTGNFRIFAKGQRPQVLIFENAKIAKFPKYLKDIERKLKLNKTLNTKEVNRLIKWQVETGSGKFKPIGSTIYSGGAELEITLAPGEWIKRIKQVGFTYIEGKKVTFVTAEIFKPTRAILKQIKLANLGKLTKNQLLKLEKFMSKKLGRKIRIETPALRKKLSRLGRRTDTSIPILRVRGNGIFVLRRTGIPKRTSGISRRIKTTPRKTTRRTTARKTVRRKTAKRTIRRTPARRTTVRSTPRQPVKRRASPRRPVRRRPAPRIPVRRRPAPRRPVGRRGTAKKKPILIPRIERGFTKRKVTSQPTFYVVEKVRGKFKKLYPKPLTAKDARDYAVYSIDNRLSKTAFFIPMGKAKQVVQPPKQIQNYYSKNSRKVRPYRIRYGKRKQLVNGFIEKRKFFNDTAGERGQLRNLRRKTIQRRPSKRKISPQQRRILIERLKKARRIRMRNLRK